MSKDLCINFHAIGFNEVDMFESSSLQICKHQTFTIFSDLPSLSDFYLGKFTSKKFILLMVNVKVLFFLRFVRPRHKVFYT
jgi:hypothetical protein